MFYGLVDVEIIFIGSSKILTTIGIHLITNHCIRHSTVPSNTYAPPAANP